MTFISREISETAEGEPVPVMHACGHDLHSSCLVGAAAVQANLREYWQVTAVLVCQPAEEVFGGARAMLDDGLYERFARPISSSETITLHNDATSTTRIRRGHDDAFGEKNFFAMPQLNASEDFAYFDNAQAGGFGGDDIPCVYWFIGTTDEARWNDTPGRSVAEKMTHLEMPHSPYYAPGQMATLKAGMKAMAVGALTFLGPRTHTI